MELMSLLLQKFRTYRKQTFEFSPFITLIIGPNAVGKTNIIEAIYTCAIGKSFRAETESDMVRWGEEIARIVAQITNHKSQFPNKFENSNDKNDETKLELVVTTGMVNGEKVPIKKYMVNGVPRRQIDFVGNLRIVLFSPSDLEIVTGSPSLRRQYLNSVLVQTDREYRRNLLSYERGLRQRNRLLDVIKEGKAQRSQLLFWDQLLIKTGSYLTDVRQSYIDFVNEYVLDDFHYRLIYDKSIISESRLDQYKDEEVAAGSTLVGPQRDDFVVEKAEDGGRRTEKNWRDVSRFGSRGEQRLAVLWLKLAELEFLTERSREAGSGSARPILLLDDIFSELDEESRNIVLSIIDKQQTIITSAEDEVTQLFNKTKNVKIIRLPMH
jgi:DNA replication and repair protein RecF